MNGGSGRKKRGIIFLFAAVTLIAVFLTIMYTARTVTSRMKGESEHLRVLTLADFLKDFSVDIHRATTIAAFRSFIALEEYISEQGSFLENTTQTFLEVFLNGTFDGKSFAVMENSTFREYLERVRVEANTIGVSLNVSVENLSLRQSAPWSVDVIFTLLLNVSDQRGVASWDTMKQYTTTVSILDLRDPVYSVFTLGKAPNTFRISPYKNSQFVTGNDTSVLYDELVNQYYRSDPHAPSFLQRLRGELNMSSPYGIASLVDLDELDAQGLSVKTYRPVLDYYYFSNISATTYCPTFGTPLPGWFKIDETHYNDPAHDYEVPLLNATIC